METVTRGDASGSVDRQPGLELPELSEAFYPGNPSYFLSPLCLHPKTALLT